MNIDPGQLFENINAELQSQADPAYRELVRERYNMNVDFFMGARTPAIHKIADKFYKTIQSEHIDQRLEQCLLLLKTLIYEHKITAFRWAYLARKEYQEKHLTVFRDWLNKFVDDWIDCDDLCIHVLGEFFLKFPDLAIKVINWTRSANLWMRRGAAVSLIQPVRKGQQLQLAFKIADLLLKDREILVQKGYGWLLKQAGKNFPNEVFDYVMDKQQVMPRIAFRYALEKLPEPMRRKAMLKE